MVEPMTASDVECSVVIIHEPANTGRAMSRTAARMRHG